MKRVVLVIGFIALVLFGRTQTVVPGGYVSGSWDQWGSPYIIQDDIIIHEDSILNISGNVEIVFEDTAGLDVYGILHAIGGDLGTIEFTAEVNTWEGIQIYGHDSAATDSIILDHCRISRGAAFSNDTNGGGLWIQNKDAVRISWCNFNTNYAEHKGGALYLKNSDILMKNSEVRINATGANSLNSRGGGIYIKDSNPAFIGVLFYGNESIEGGGVFSTNSSPCFMYCGFQENSCVNEGGAMRCTNNGSLIMDYCDVIDNTAGKNGGALSLYYSVSSYFSYVNFINNGSNSNVNTINGGAIYVWSCPTQYFENCTFSDNSATDWGGAIECFSTLKLSGCLFSSNTSGSGGAISSYWSYLTAVNCTFSNNTCMYYGTTLWSVSGMIELTNCILWDPFPNPDKKAIFLFDSTQDACLRAQQSNIQLGEDNISGGCILLWSNIIDEYPGFVHPLYDFSLKWNSPCINTGRSDTMTSLISETDLNGDPRILGGEIDMGAYEFQGPFTVNDQLVIKQFEIYPNPNNGYFNLSLEQDFGISAKMELYSMGGKHIYTQEVNSKRQIVKLPRFPEGVYLVRVTGNGKFGTSKMIITN